MILNVIWQFVKFLRVSTNKKGEFISFGGRKYHVGVLD